METCFGIRDPCPCPVQVHNAILLESFGEGKRAREFTVGHVFSCGRLVDQDEDRVLIYLLTNVNFVSFLVLVKV